MTEKINENSGLEASFDDIRREVPAPSNDLMARVLRDAEDAQAAFAPDRATSAPLSNWRDVLRALGGWPAMAGLATAAVTGVWLGVSPPGVLPDLTGIYFDDAVVMIDADPGLGFDLFEEAL